MFTYDGQCAPSDLLEVFARGSPGGNVVVLESRSTPVYIKTEGHPDYFVGKAHVRMLDDGRIWATASLNQPLPENTGWDVMVQRSWRTLQWRPVRLSVAEDAHPECIPILDETDGPE